MGLCRRLVFTYIRLTFILVLHTVFVSTVVARVLQSSEWPWPAVFSPLFLFDLIYIIYLFIYGAGFVRDKMEGEASQHNTSCFPHQEAGLIPLVFYIIGIVLKIIAEILLVVYLTDSSVPFFVSSLFMMLFFIVLSTGMFFYSIKPTVEWLKEKY